MVNCTTLGEVLNNTLFATEVQRLCERLDGHCSTLGKIRQTSCHDFTDGPPTTTTSAYNQEAEFLLLIMMVRPTPKYKVQSRFIMELFAWIRSLI